MNYSVQGAGSKQIADAFLKFFGKSASPIGEVNSVLESGFAKRRNSNSFYFRPIDPSEVVRNTLGLPLSGS